MSDHGTSVSGNRTAVARHGRTAIAALRLNWSGLDDGFRIKSGTNKLMKVCSLLRRSAGVLSNLRN
jgi:hypothetical protein